jgi:Na+/melibiose symporter-like transporter
MLRPLMAVPEARSRLARLRTHLTYAAYGLGQMAEGLKNGSFEVYIFFYYTSVLGLSGSLAGLATFLALFFDAVSDPVVGSLSDRTRHRFGRRHPWLYVSPVPLALLFVGLFRPPGGLGEMGLFAWLFVFAVLTRLAITLFHVPHMALGAELSEDYGERTTIVGYRTFFALFGAGLAAVAGLRFFFAPSEAYPDGRLDPAQYPPYAVAAALCMLFAMYLCALGTHHRIATLRPVRHDLEAWSLRRVWREMREALANRSFRALFLGVIVFSVTRGVQTTLGLHMGTYLWQLTKGQLAQVNATFLAGFLLGVPFWTVVSRRVDKRPTILLGVTIFSLFVFAPPILWILDWFPARGTLAYMGTLLWMAFVAAFGGSAGLIAAGSMMADIADEHELRVGRRQEGVFFGALAFSQKSASGLGILFAGLGIDAIAFPLQAEVGSVPRSVLVKLGVLYGPGILVLALIAFGILLGYRLDRARHAEIVAALDARRRGARAG